MFVLLLSEAVMLRNGLQGDKNKAFSFEWWMKKAISEIVCADLMPISVRMGVRALHDWMIAFDCVCVGIDERQWVRSLVWCTSFPFSLFNISFSFAQSPQMKLTCTVTDLWFLICCQLVNLVPVWLHLSLQLKQLYSPPPRISLTYLKLGTFEKSAITLLFPLFSIST